MALTPKTPPKSVDRAAEQRAAQEQVFLREVDDALREDDAARLFRNYGLQIGAVIFAVLAGLAGWMAWTNHVEFEAGRKAEALTVALDQVEAGRYDPARTSLEAVAGQGGPGYTAAARLIEGGVALDRKQNAEAAKTFATVSTDSQAPQAYRDLATIREVSAKFDTLPPQQVIDRLKSLAVPGGVWFGSAGEMVGVAELKLGQKAQAGALFAAIAKDAGVPATLRRRSSQLAAELGVYSADPGLGAAPAQ